MGEGAKITQEKTVHIQEWRSRKLSPHYYGIKSGFEVWTYWREVSLLTDLCANTFLL